MAEYKEIIEKIKWYLEILGSQSVLMGVIREELDAMITQYGDERRTEIRESEDDLSYEDMIVEEDRVVTLSHEGYVKTQPLADYTAQRRGGRGKSATSMKDEDFIDKLFVASSHDTILCFTNAGQVYWKKVYELPLASRGSRGRPIINILPLDPDEKVNAILPIKEFVDGQFILQATANGTVKKTPLLDYSRPRSNGIRAIELREGDKLIDIQLTDGQQDIMLFSTEGKAIRFNESLVRSMGRVVTGVRGIKLPEGHKVISLIVVPPECEDRYVLTATENGYGKRTHLSLIHI